MNINTRRFIALLFIIAFCIATPLLLLYTAGYRYNFKKSQLQKTGALTIKTVPTGATVSLNNNLVSGATPVRLNNIIPDEYKVTVTKEGYYPWEKKLAIKAQETTFAEDIILFAKATPEIVIDKQITWFAFSKAHKFALLKTGDKTKPSLTLLNLSNSKEKILFEDAALDKNFSILWSHDDANVLISRNGKTSITTTYFNPQTMDLTKKVADYKLNNFKWDITNSNILFAQSGNSIYQLNLITNTADKFFTTDKSDSLIDYLIYNGEAFVIENLKSNTLLTKYALDGEKPKIIDQTIELPDGNFRFDQVYRDKLGLVGAKDSTFYLTDLGLNKVLFSKAHVGNIDLNENNELLLIQTDQELSYINIAETELSEQTITRYSQDLVASSWHHKSTNYTFALHDGRLQIIELDNREGHLVIDLPGEKIEQFATDQKSQNIFFFANKQIYRLPIK